MAYQVPSLSDILYSKSRVPTPEQVTLNNLLSFLDNAQQIKSEAANTKMRMDFTRQNDKEDRDWRSGEAVKRRAIEAQNERTRQRERDADISRQNAHREEDDAQRQADRARNRIVRALEGGHLESAATYAAGSTAIFENAGLTADLEGLRGEINTGKTRKASISALDTKVMVTLREGGDIPALLASDDWKNFSTDQHRTMIADKDKLVFSTMAAAERIFMSKEYDRLTDKEGFLLEQRREELSKGTAIDENGIKSQTLLDIDKDFDDIQIQKNELRLNPYSFLKSADKGKNTLLDYEYGPSDLDEAIGTFIRLNSEKGIAFANGSIHKDTPDARAHIKGLIDSGDIKPIFSNGNYSTFMNKTQWQASGLQVAPEGNEDEGEKQKPKDVGVYGKEFDADIQKLNEDGILAKGADNRMGDYTHQVSYWMDIGDPKGKRLKLGTLSELENVLDETQYVPSRVREYAGAAKYFTTKQDDVFSDFKMNLAKYKRSKEGAAQGQIVVKLQNFLNKKDAIQERLTDLTMKIDEDLRTNNVDVYERAHFIKLNARIKKELKKMSTIDAFYEQMAKTFPAILPPDRVFP